jgi:hypothetical protein
MSRGKWNLVILLLSLILVKCKDDVPVTPGTKLEYTNEELAVQLSHYQYSDNFFSIQFFSDGTFLEYVTDSRTSQQESQRLYTRTGKYTLDGNLLKLSDVNVDFNTSMHGISIIWYDQEVSLDAGKNIVFKTVTVLDADNFKNEIWNCWKTKKWVAHYVETTGIIYNGKEEYFYEFKQSDPKLRRGVNYPLGVPFISYEYKTVFYYTNPYLSIPSEAGNYLVEFKNNKMYWYFDNSLLKAGKSLTKCSLAPQFISFN